MVFRPSSAILSAGEPGITLRKDGQPADLSVGRTTDSSLAAELCLTETGGFELLAFEPGRYTLKTAQGRSKDIAVDPLPEPMEVRGPWELRFQAHRGAPEQVTLPALSDWAKHSDPGVKFISGTATYRKTLVWSPPA